MIPIRSVCASAVVNRHTAAAASAKRNIHFSLRNPIVFSPVGNDANPHRRCYPDADPASAVARTCHWTEKSGRFVSENSETLRERARFSSFLAGDFS
jgi:hypothetical protein